MILLERFSSLRKILEIVSYILRFGFRMTPIQYHSLDTCQSELNNALIVLVVYVQQECFPDIFKALKKGKRIPKPYCKLSPFLDNRGSIRVGGRLMLSKYPVLLPSRHLLTFYCNIFGFYRRDEPFRVACRSVVSASGLIQSP